MTKRVKYQAPNKGIYHDLDGTLTGLGPNSYATAYWPHNNQSECQYIPDLYSGYICDNTTSVRRIVFHGGTGNIKAKTMYIWRYDDDIIGSMDATQLEQYLVKENASELAYMELSNPMFHWTVPYVTGHRYYVRW